MRYVLGLLAVTSFFSISCSSEMIVEEEKPLWLMFDRYDSASARFTLTVDLDRTCFVHVSRGGVPTEDGMFCEVENGPTRRGLVETSVAENLAALLSDDLLPVYQKDAVDDPGDQCTDPNGFHLAVFHDAGRNIGSPWFSSSKGLRSEETEVLLDSLNEILRSCHADGEPWSPADAELESQGGWPAP